MPPADVNTRRTWRHGMQIAAKTSCNLPVQVQPVLGQSHPQQQPCTLKAHLLEQLLQQHRRCAARL